MLAASSSMVNGLPAAPPWIEHAVVHHRVARVARREDDLQVQSHPAGLVREHPTVDLLHHDVDEHQRDLGLRRAEPQGGGRAVRSEHSVAELNQGVHRDLRAAPSSSTARMVSHATAADAGAAEALQGTAAPAGLGR